MTGQRENGAGEAVVAIQVGAVSFTDEGVDAVLDVVQEAARVNTLFLATPTWVRGTGGRAVPGHPLPDHGVQEYDLDFHGGDYARAHAEYYGGTILPPVPRAPEFPGFDLLAEVVPAAHDRGMRAYAWMEESSYVQAVRDIPNMPKTLEVDVWGRPSSRPCFNNPDYRGWHLSMVEDYAKSYPIDGLAWCSERPGPLNATLQGRISAAGITCFCDHCRSKARERGIDPERAQQGFEQLLAWNEKLAAGGRHSDGAFTTFWRILLRYPEVLAWQNLWTESQRDLYRDIYGVAKASNRDLQVGWHVFHDISFSPFYRADQDFAELGKLCDFIKLVSYNTAAGPRFHSWTTNIAATLFADVRAEDLYGVLLQLLGLDEVPLDRLRQTGFSADSVRRETERAIRSAPAGTAIYPGIDIDIPVGSTEAAVADRRQRHEGTPGLPPERFVPTEVDLARSTPEGVAAAVSAAFDGGAHGVVLSRKYSEMQLSNLRAVGPVVDRIHARRA